MTRTLLFGILIDLLFATAGQSQESPLVRLPAQAPFVLQSDGRLQPYLEVLRNQGREPIRFVLQALKRHDLIIFDDAVHTALEPFEFYQQLIRDKAFQQQAPAIFLEIVSINRQRHLDAYLNAARDDPRLLCPAFQDELNGNGWGLRTYFDFLRTVRAVNQALPAKSKLRVYAVNSPTLWPEIQTRDDLVQFRKSTASRDHHMYVAILNELAEFKAKRKGIFLTNTRHAYKGIRQKDGQFFWNAATFFHQWHPGKAYSIRMHNVTPQVVRALATSPPGTFEGRPSHEIRFVRMARGLWDSAFRASGNRPVAFALQGNVFGAERYTGADEFDALPDQKMQDAYDAVIFLAPPREAAAKRHDRLYLHPRIHEGIETTHADHVHRSATGAGAQESRSQGPR